MTTQDAERYRRALLRRTRALLSPRNDSSSGDADRAGNRAPASAAARAGAAADFLLSLSEAEYVELLAVRRALARLDCGGFGRCIDCGHGIEPHRLDAAPWTDDCGGCAQPRSRRRATATGGRQPSVPPHAA